MTSTAAAVVWNGLDGLINSKPFMPGASPGQRAKVMMELAEQDGELLGVHERRLVLRYAEAVRDDRRTVSLINELCESGHERQFGHVDLPSQLHIAQSLLPVASDIHPLCSFHFPTPFPGFFLPYGESIFFSPPSPLYYIFSSAFFYILSLALTIVSILDGPGNPAGLPADMLDGLIGTHEEDPDFFP